MVDTPSELELQHEYRKLMITLWQFQEEISISFQKETGVHKEYLSHKLLDSHKLQEKIMKTIDPLMIKFKAECNYLKAIKKDSSKLYLKYKTKLETLLEDYNRQIKLIYTPK